MDQSIINNKQFPTLRHNAPKFQMAKTMLDDKLRLGFQTGSFDLSSASQGSGSLSRGTCSCMHTPFDFMPGRTYICSSLWNCVLRWTL